jgi:hypothetical protein
MKNSLSRLTVALRVPCLLAAVCCAAVAADADKGEHAISFADGKLKLVAPDSWKRTKPQNNIIEHEFTIPAAEGDARDGRLTVSTATGGVEPNVQRWIGQFSQPDGSETKNQAKTKKLAAAGEDIFLVDLSGTFKDRPAPFAPAVERPKYRMLGAIISTKKLGTHFVKFYGPEKTVADNEKGFMKMIEGLEEKK